MQRLFSSFADGCPGGGLLIQRLLVGATLLHAGFSCMSTTPMGVTWAPQVIGGLCGVFLIVGLWTPVVGFLTAAVQSWVAFTSPGEWRIAVFLAVLAATLAMIGPGAWSVDARLFGRKHIVREVRVELPQKS